ncbi:MAG: efflux RND transporter periplasmic adaptor subunit [Pseudomonadales bacterium]|jgi:HlyD family secretion protein|nr:efflux RND transporter periplasmic adaptor subunit [Pseudomonadales bacterium]
MDRKIEKSRKPLLIKLGAGAVLAVGLAWLAHGALTDAAISTFRVERERLSIGVVTSGRFEDFIPVRGTVTPAISVFLDAVEGGRVEKVFVKNGAQVHAGQPLVELSNTALQLDVISREAQVTEQLNNLRNTRLAMEQNRLSLKRDLVEVDYHIKSLETTVARQEQLYSRGALSQATNQDTKDELAYYRQRREVTIESQRQDETMRMAQIDSLESGVAQLQKNLEIARKNLDSLIITAPIDGQLSSFNTEMGQSKQRGESLGQIDNVDDFKLTVLVDEFYVTRTREGQAGEFTLAGKSYPLSVSRVYPQVVNGQFEIDMSFTGAIPSDIRRGQTLQIRMQLGDASAALLLPRGGFFQDTGGNWAFVLDASGHYAYRRDISLGRRNPEYFEVLSGLEQGEQVIISEYAAFAQMQRIELNQ